MTQTLRASRPLTLIRTWPATLPGLGGVAALIYFDLGPPLFANDDWVYSWSAQHVSWPLHLYPKQSVPAIVQVLWAWVLTLGHGDQRLLRLTLVPFALAAVTSVAWLSHRIGASRFWSLAAGSTLLVSPLFMTTATTFMSDVPYIALLLMALVAAEAWITRGRLRWLTIVLTFLATLQRPMGVLLPLPITLAIVMSSGRERGSRQMPQIVLLWVAAALGTLMPGLLHITPAAESARMGAIGQIHLRESLLAVTFLLPVLVLLLVPFGAGAISAVRGQFGLHRLMVVLICLAGFALLAVLARPDGLFPGNLWVADGIGHDLGGTKPAGWFPLAYLATAALVLVLLPFVVVAVTQLVASEVTPAVLLCVTAGATQLLPLLPVSQLSGGFAIFDRYYLPVVAPLIPVAALMASRAPHQGLARAWFAVGAGLSLTVFTFAEQDYQAWQVARDAAAHLAYARLAPAQVNAGYDANAKYLEIPEYERTGVTPPGVGSPISPRDLALFGPPGALLQLTFGAADDPRPGVSYHSWLARGRVVLTTPTDN